MNQGQLLESGIEKTPSWIKTSYVKTMRALKTVLRLSGALAHLDQQAKQNQRAHFFRSLLAIHDLKDMIALDTPWWTYSAIAEVEQFLKNCDHKAQVFEYGSGASTIWLAKRCAKVVSVEHDKAWFFHLKNQIADFHNIELVLKEPEYTLDEKYRSQKAPAVTFKAYVTAIQETQQQFDLIIIDGRSRGACLEECLPYLKPRGMILLDNSNRERYQNDLIQSGLEIRRCYGQVPGSPLKSETALLSQKAMS
jgi:hypothetical protein